MGVAQACFNVPIITAATYWFRRRLAVGIGLLQAAHGLGPAIMAVLLTVMLSAMAWKTAFWLIGISGGAVMVGLIAVESPTDPELYGSCQSKKDIMIYL